jgi:hypothetical protein
MGFRPPVADVRAGVFFSGSRETFAPHLPGRGEAATTNTVIPSEAERSRGTSPSPVLHAGLASHDNRFDQLSPTAKSQILESTPFPLHA